MKKKKMARVIECRKQFIFQSVIRGYHVYKDVWEPEIGEEFECQIEETNGYDKNAVAVVKNANIIGHIPRENAKVSQFFFKTWWMHYMYSNRKKTKPEC